MLSKGAQAGQEGDMPVGPAAFVKAGGGVAGVSGNDGPEALLFSDGLNQLAHRGQDLSRALVGYHPQRGGIASFPVALYYLQGKGKKTHHSRAAAGKDLLGQSMVRQHGPAQPEKARVVC